MPSLSTLVDNFNSGTVGPNWGDSYGGVSIVAGRARVPLVAGAYAGFQTGRAWTLAGAAIYLKLASRPAASTGTDVSQNFMVTSPTAGTGIGFKYNAVTSKLRMQSNVDYYDATAVEITYSATDHLWLRLREDGTNIYWDTSPNGSTWTNRRTLATPAWVTEAIDGCALDLFCFRDAGATDFAEFDNVNTLSDGAVVTATGSGTMTTAATSAAKRTATGTGTGALDTMATAAASAVYHATGSGSLDTDATATAGGSDHNDIDFTLGRPHSGWVVSAPWT
ncbi:hypothetical protein [Streptomyces anthocyanicus]|uniref:hypothetical protein n=1 Tax=Streptomyces anthocyanicus TaxID=68174 RepID=UPI00386F66B2|nr:hypothetical protein OH747_05315 [Streptomyces anthocyanicus]